MNKSELIDAMASKTGMTKADAGRALEAFTSTVEDVVSKGDTLTLVGFGTFGVKERNERTGRNPRTGEPLTIAAKKLPYFKPGAGLKEKA